MKKRYWRQNGYTKTIYISNQISFKYHVYWNNKVDLQVSNVYFENCVWIVQ